MEKSNKSLRSKFMAAVAGVALFASTLLAAGPAQAIPAKAPPDQMMTELQKEGWKAVGGGFVPIRESDGTINNHGLSIMFFKNNKDNWLLLQGNSGTVLKSANGEGLKAFLNDGFLVSFSDPEGKGNVQNRLQPISHVVRKSTFRCGPEGTAKPYDELKGILKELYKETRVLSGKMKQGENNYALEVFDTAGEGGSFSVVSTNKGNNESCVVFSGLGFEFSPGALESRSVDPDVLKGLYKRVSGEKTSPSTQRDFTAPLKAVIG